MHERGGSRLSLAERRDPNAELFQKNVSPREYRTPADGCRHALSLRLFDRGGVRHRVRFRLQHALGGFAGRRLPRQGRLDSRPAGKVRHASRLPDGRRNRVRRESLGRRRPAEHLLAAEARRAVDAGHLEASLGQGPRLVDDDGVHREERVEAVGALDQDLVARRVAHAAEIAERYRDDEGAGAGNDEEHEGAVEPIREGGARHDDGRHYRDERRRYDDEGRVHGRYPGHEPLGGSLARRRVLDELEDARHRRLSEGRRDAHEDPPGVVDIAGPHGHPGGSLERCRFARQRRGVQERFALDDFAVQRHALAGAHFDDVAHRHRRGIGEARLASRDHAGEFRAQVHEFGD